MMTEETRLLGQGKKEKANKRDSTSLNKVRNFLARYSDDAEENTLLDSEKGPSFLGKTARKYRAVREEEQDKRDVAFVSGQDGSFKILDEDESDFQAPTLEEELVPEDQLTNFQLTYHSPSESEDPLSSPQSVPFVSGQGDSFKILDENAPDIQESTFEGSRVLGEQTTAFQMTDNKFPGSLSETRGDQDDLETMRPFPFLSMGEEQNKKNEAVKSVTTVDSLSSEPLSEPPSEITQDDGEKSSVEVTAPASLESVVNPVEHGQESLGLHSGGISSLSFTGRAEEESHLHPCLVSFLEPDSFASEQYRGLSSRIEHLKEAQDNAYVVGVTSPSDEDGKTITALNLAGALARNSETRVLLVDAALRRPVIPERLGSSLINRKGLVEALKSPRLKLKNLTVQYPQLNLTVLPTGRATSTTEILSSPRLFSLLGEARREYDYIVIDMPSVPSLPISRLIEDYLDGILVVVAAHKTPRKLVQETLSVLYEKKILGLIFNGQ